LACKFLSMGMNGYSVRPKNKPSPGLRRVTVLWAAPTWPALIGWLSSWTAPEAWRAWHKWWIAGSIRPACVLRSAGNNSNVLAFTTPSLEPGHVQHSARAVNEPLIDRVQLPAAFEQKIAVVFQLVARISSVANGVPEKPQHGTGDWRKSSTARCMT